MQLNKWTEAFDIRPGERSLALLFFTYFMVLETAHYVCKTVRQSTFIDSVGPENLPWVYLAVALSSLPVLVIYTRLTERVDHSRLVIVSTLLLAAGLVVFYVLFGLGTVWVSALFYVTMTVAFGIAVSQLWTLAHDVFDARQARRLFAFVTAGGLLGGIPGGQIALFAAGRFNTRSALLAAALLLLLVAFLVFVITTRAALHARGSVTSRNIEDARGGLSDIRGSRLLLFIAALMTMTVVVAQMVDLQFYWVLEQNTEGLDQRTKVVGIFFSIMGLFAFVFQILFTRRIHRVLGVEAGMRVLPGSVVIMGVVFVIALGISPVAAFAVAWALKVTETGFRHSIDQSTRELLFQPLGEQIRRRAKAFVDVFVQRAAKGVAAALLLPVTFKLVTMSQLSVATVVAALLWLALTWLVRREYVNSYRRGLASGVLQEPAVIDPGDITTITTLVQSLGSSKPREVIHSLDLLADNGHANLVPPLLLHHHDAEVRRRTLEVLGASGRYDATPLVEAAVADDDPRVRSGAIQTLGLLDGTRAAEFMVSRLDDPDPGARAAAAATLLTADDQESVARAEKTLESMIADDCSMVRSEAAAALASVAEPIGCASLVQLLYDGELEVVREAVKAVRQRIGRDGYNPIYVPILISLMGHRRLKHDAREALVACGEGAMAALALFMGSPDEQIWVRRAVPKTIAMAGTQPAVDVLLAALGEGDALLRGKIVEALAPLRSNGHDLHFAPQVVRRQIRLESRRAMSILADLWAVSQPGSLRPDGPFVFIAPGAGQATLLQHLLIVELRQAVERLFRLLGLVYPQEDMRATWRSLAEGSSQLRARALEYLDNTLRGAVKVDVFAVVDDSPLEIRLNRALQVLGSQQASREETLVRLLHTDLKQNPAAEAMAMAAAHSVHVLGLTDLLDDIRKVASLSEDPLLVETAQWVLESEAERTGVTMADETTRTMARIEMVMFLQEVDLFSACTAEQIVQLASIASECRCDRDEVIYCTDDSSDALFCVVGGRVALRSPEGTSTEVTTGGRFGVVDILSDRARPCEAVALEPETHLLTIQTEDFFDLLSNNIEIVRALFRQVTAE